MNLHSKISHFHPFRLSGVSTSYGSTSSPATYRVLGIVAVIGLIVAGVVVVSYTMKSGQSASWGTPSYADYIIDHIDSTYRLYETAGSKTVTTSTNSTYLMTLATGNFTSRGNGTLYLKDVAWPYALLTVPSGSLVWENLNGVTRYFINSTDATGSSFTVSVGSGVDAGYYFAADSQGRFCWASTDAGDLINDTINVLATPSDAGVYGGTLFIAKGETDYYTNTTIHMRDRVDVVAEKDATLTATAVLDTMFSYEYSTTTAIRSTISGLRIEGNNLAVSAFIFLNATTNIVLDDLEIYGTTSTTLALNGAWGISVYDSEISAPAMAYCVQLVRNVEANTGNHLNTFVNDHFIGGARDVCISGDAYGNVFYRCFFSSAQGIYISGDGTYIPTLTTIQYSWFEQTAVVGNKKAIEIVDAGSDTIPRETLIMGNHFGLYDYGVFLSQANGTIVEDNYYSGIGAFDIYIETTNVTYTSIENNYPTTLAKFLSNGGTNTVVGNNGGYLTHNVVQSANTTVTTFVFNHGLAGDLDASGVHGTVQATFDASTAAVITGYSWSSTTTQITITVYVIAGESLPATMTVTADLTYLP